VTERYDEETLAALARPSVAPPTSLEESSSQYPDASGKAVVDLRALRDSMAPAPGVRALLEKELQTPSLVASRA